ncbi:unnamed protein product [Heterobilharzia americana]|nr:unnamed protein product [Heterobilharzia americana]
MLVVVPVSPSTEKTVLNKWERHLALEKLDSTNSFESSPELSDGTPSLRFFLFSIYENSRFEQVCQSITSFLSYLILNFIIFDLHVFVTLQNKVSEALLSVSMNK